MPNKPFFGILYGPSGSGKTLSCLRSWPDALFISLEGGLNCAEYLGLESKDVKSVVPKSVSHIVSLIRKMDTKVPAIIIDDFSIIGRCRVSCNVGVWQMGRLRGANSRHALMREEARKASALLL